MSAPAVWRRASAWRSVEADHRAAIGRAEAAVVAVPNHLHAPLALDLLRGGLHVLVEKPMALSAADCDAMIAAAAASRARLTVGLQFRFFDSTALVRDLLAADLLGPLRRFDLRLGVVSRWPFATDFALRREAAGGGVLVDYGVHVLDLLLHWLGDLAPRGYRDDAEGGVEANCELELEHASGLRGAVEISRTRNLRNTCVFEGEAARLEVGIWDPDPPVVLSAAGRDLRLDGRARRGGAAAGGERAGARLHRRLPPPARRFRGGDPGVARARDQRRRRAPRRGADRRLLRRPCPPRAALDVTAAARGSGAVSLAALERELRGRRVLVTGGSGFIGGRLVERLVRRSGAEVRVLVRRFASAAGLARFPIEFVSGDVTDPPALAAAVAGCDLVFHCAYGTTGSQRRRAFVNREGTRRLLDRGRRRRRGARRPPQHAHGLRPHSRRRSRRERAAAALRQRLRRQQARRRARGARLRRAPAGWRRWCSSPPRSTAPTAACGPSACWRSSAAAG